MSCPDHNHMCIIAQCRVRDTVRQHFVHLRYLPSFLYMGNWSYLPLSIPHASFYNGQLAIISDRSPFSEPSHLTDHTVFCHVGQYWHMVVVDNQLLCLKTVAKSQKMDRLFSSIQLLLTSSRIVKHINHFYCLELFECRGRRFFK